MFISSHIHDSYDIILETQSLITLKDLVRENFHSLQIQFISNDL